MPNKYRNLKDLYKNLKDLRIDIFEKIKRLPNDTNMVDKDISYLCRVVGCINTELSEIKAHWGGYGSDDSASEWDIDQYNRINSRAQAVYDKYKSE